MLRGFIALPSMLVSAILWHGIALVALPLQDAKPEPVTTRAQPATEADDLAIPEPEWFKGAFRSGEPGLTFPIAIKLMPPDYPIRAQMKEVTGEVHLDIRVEADGKVSHTRVVRSIPALDASAMKAAEKFEFLPARKDGEAVAAIVRVVLEFSRR